MILWVNTSEMRGVLLILRKGSTQLTQLWAGELYLLRGEMVKDSGGEKLTFSANIISSVVIIICPMRTFDFLPHIWL